ncbi:MAG: DUF58 domain-containing protein [Haliscomenobacter sp.]|nr:DUF58 domain-containing protein [Haliscomenobacter sp.]
METSELLKKVRKIEIKIKGLSRHLFSGEYHSAFKGRGMSFSEVRSYQYGDDVRNIDWNVTARTGEPHVKVYEEERELTVMLLVDVSRSAFFGSVKQFKSEMITEICALLSFSAITNNDKVGLILFTDQVELFIPPKKGRYHILRIIRELIDFQVKGRSTDLGKTLEYFHHVIKKRSICFVLSDFLTAGYENALRVAARRHDVIGVRITDVREETLPDIGLLPVEDAETGKTAWLDTSSERVRDQYARRFEDSSRYFKGTFLRSGADTIDIRTHESYVHALLNFFQKRAGK